MLDMIKFPDIDQIIKKYYLIDKDENDSTYKTYQNTKELKSVVASHLASPKNRVQWGILIATIKKAFPELGEIRETRSPSDVCFSVTIVVSRKEVESFVYEQRLFCRLSFLGDYFCIYGLDYIQVDSNSNKIEFEPVLTISPSNNYEECFKKVRDIVEKLFPTYRYLSFFYLRISIDGLIISPANLINNQFSNIFQALFVHKNITNYITYGDMSYK